MSTVYMNVRCFTYVINSILYVLLNIFNVSINELRNKLSSISVHLVSSLLIPRVHNNNYFSCSLISYTIVGTCINFKKSHRSRNQCAYYFSVCKGLVSGRVCMCVCVYRKPDQ